MVVINSEYARNNVIQAALAEVKTQSQLGNLYVDISPQPEWVIAALTDLGFKTETTQKANFRGNGTYTQLRISWK